MLLSIPCSSTSHCKHLLGGLPGPRRSAALGPAPPAPVLLYVTCAGCVPTWSGINQHPSMQFPSLDAIWRSVLTCRLQVSSCGHESCYKLIDQSCNLHMGLAWICYAVQISRLQACVGQTGGCTLGCRSRLVGEHVRTACVVRATCEWWASLAWTAGMRRPLAMAPPRGSP